MCVQETHGSESSEQMWTSEWGGYKALYSHGTSAARGVAIFIKKGINYRVTRTNSDNAGRIIVCELEHLDDPQKKLMLCNIYGPNKDSPSFYLEVLKLIGDMSPNIILIGDYNLVINPSLDRKGSSFNPIKAVEVVREICEEMLLVDIWRVRNPQEKQYSWMRVRPQYLASRIDFALVSQGITSNVLQTMYLPGIKSDHLAYYISIDLLNNDRGPGFWKFNNSLLAEKDFCDAINNVIIIEKENVTNLLAVDTWTYMKQKIITVSKSYSKRIACEKKLIISQLSEKILQLEHEVTQSCEINP